VLGDWHHVIEVDDSTARSQLGELIRSGSLRLDKLARAARDEPATVRHRLKNLLAANGYGALAASIPAPRSIARFAHEAAAPS
jgi:hypothetical protein